MFEGWGGDILNLMRKRQPIKDDILPDGGSAFVETWGGTIIEGWGGLKSSCSWLEGFGGH